MHMIGVIDVSVNNYWIGAIIFFLRMTIKNKNRSIVESCHML